LFAKSNCPPPHLACLVSGGDLTRRGIVSLVDLYTGFTVFSLWICFREPSRVVASALVVMMMTTGWLGGSLYVLNLLRQYNGDWQWFFMGGARKP